MKTLLLGLLLLGLAVGFANAEPAGELVIVPGGVSPDKSLAIAIVPPPLGDYFAKADQSIYLVKYPGMEIVRRTDPPQHPRYPWEPNPIREWDRCVWSPDGRNVAIDKRRSFCVLSVSESDFSLVTLPDESSHPKGKIFKVVRPAEDAVPHHGERFVGWLSPTSFAACEYGLEEDIPYPSNKPISVDDLTKGPRTDYTEYGFPSFNGKIEKVYELKDSQWVLADLKSGPSSSLAILPGGVSPDGKLAIGVYPPRPYELPEADCDAVYLVRYPSLEIVKVIDRLKRPGFYSLTLRLNEHDPCTWSPDGRHVAIDRQFTYVVLSVSGTSLAQVKRPDELSHPKGRVYEAISAAGPQGRVHGERFVRWLSDTSFVACEFGLGRRGVYSGAGVGLPPSFFKRDNPSTTAVAAAVGNAMPPALAPDSPPGSPAEADAPSPETPLDLSTYGFPKFTGKIEKVYTLEEDRWTLSDLRSPEPAK